MGGFWAEYRALGCEAVTFAIVSRLRVDATHVELGTRELSMLLEGIDASLARMAPRWARPPHLSATLRSGRPNRELSRGWRATA